MSILETARSCIRLPFHYLRSKPFTGIILHWWDWERDNTAWVRVLFTPDPRHRDDAVFLLRMAGRFRDSDLDDKPGTEPERALQAVLIANRDLQRTRLREIPAGITDGVQMFISTTYIDRDRVFKDFDIRNPYHRIIPCRIDPASDGPVFASKYKRRLMCTRHPGIIEQLRATAQPVTAARIMANRGLYEPGNRDLPAMVIFSFDRAMTDDRLMAIARRMQTLRNCDPANPDEVVVRALLDDLHERIYERDPLPTGFTGGPVVYAAGLFIRRDCLPLGYLRTDDDDLYPCLAEPGPEGALEMLKPIA